MDEEQPLSGGNASDFVVRVGSTVRKPWTAATPNVFDYMTALRSSGIDVPDVLGRDEHGRQMTEFIPGRLAIESERLTRAELHRVGAMVRAIHDASERFVPSADATWSAAIPAPDAELICHNDLAPWNLIVGERWVFIDWDSAAPSTRLWDLAYAAQAFTLNDIALAPEDAARDLAAFVDGYGADRRIREALPREMHRRTSAMFALLHESHDSGREPWASMFSSGHGDHWRAASEYVARHLDVWASVLLRRGRTAP